MGKVDITSRLARSRVGPILVLMVLLLVQFAHLDADPSPLKKFGDVSDEGYWVHNARCLTLFGDALPDDLNQGYHGAPAFFVLESLAFRILGVSFFSARLVTLVCFQLVVVQLFLMFWLRFGSGWYGLAPAIALGMCHEALVFARWATPIPVILLCVTAAIFFFEIGRSTGRSGWFFLSGIAGPMAVFGKLTAVFVLPALVIFFAFEIVVRRRLERSQIRLLVLGLVAGVILLGVFLFAASDGIRALDQNLGGGALRNLPEKGSVGTWLYSRFVDRTARYLHHSPGGTVLRSVGTSMLTLAVWAWFVTVVNQMRKTGWRRVLASFESFEVFSVIMIIGFPACLIASGTGNWSRRLALLLVPLALLAAAFVMKAIHSPKAAGGSCRGGGLRFSPAMMVALIFHAALAWVLLGGSSEVLFARWLEPSGLAGPSTRLAAAMLVTIVWLVIVGVSLAGRRAYAAAVAAVFVLVNGTLNTICFMAPTYTVRDASRDLAGRLEHRELISGCRAHWLALETQALPIWYLVGEEWESSPWKAVWNGSFLPQMRETGASLVTLVPSDSDGTTYYASYVLPRRLPAWERETLVAVRAAPYALTETHRLSTSVVRLHAPGPDVASAAD